MLMGWMLAAPGPTLSSGSCLFGSSAMMSLQLLALSFQRVPSKKRMERSTRSVYRAVLCLRAQKQRHRSLGKPARLGMRDYNFQVIVRMKSTPNYSTGTQTKERSKCHNFNSLQQLRQKNHKPCSFADLREVFTVGEPPQNAVAKAQAKLCSRELSCSDPERSWAVNPISLAPVSLEAP